MKKNWLMDIAQLVRYMKDPQAKKYVTDRWGKVAILVNDDLKAQRLIKAILLEKIEKIAEFI